MIIFFIIYKVVDIGLSKFLRNLLNPFLLLKALSHY